MDFEIDKKGRLVSYSGTEPCVRIPDGVTEVCDEAIFNVGSMKELVIPEGVTRLGVNAVNFCLGLEKVTLPDSLETIGKGAFQLCWRLKEVHLGSRVQVIEDGAFYRCLSLCKINFPPTLKELGHYAFQWCSIEEAILPEGLQSIGLGCFSGCNDLKKLYIPSTATVLGYGMITGCGEDLQVEVGEDHPYVRGEGCSILSKNGILVANSAVSTGTWQVPEGMEIIGKEAMTDSMISAVVLPYTVHTIADSAFEDCKELTEVQMPLLLREIYPRAFAGCEKLTRLVLPPIVRMIGDEAFRNTGITELDLPKTVEEVGWDILGECDVHRLVIRGKPSFRGAICSTFALDEDAELIADALTFEEYPKPFQPIHGMRGYARRVLEKETVDPAASERFLAYLREHQKTLEREPLYQCLIHALEG